MLTVARGSRAGCLGTTGYRVIDTVNHVPTHHATRVDDDPARSRHCHSWATLSDWLAGMQGTRINVPT